MLLEPKDIIKIFPHKVKGSHIIGLLCSDIEYIKFYENDIEYTVTDALRDFLDDTIKNKYFTIAIIGDINLQLKINKCYLPETYFNIPELQYEYQKAFFEDNINLFYKWSIHNDLEVYAYEKRDLSPPGMSYDSYNEFYYNRIIPEYDNTYFLNYSSLPTLDQLVIDSSTIKIGTMLIRNDSTHDVSSFNYNHGVYKKSNNPLYYTYLIDNTAIIEEIEYIGSDYTSNILHNIVLPNIYTYFKVDLKIDGTNFLIILNNCILVLVNDSSRYITNTQSYDKKYDYIIATYNDNYYAIRDEFSELPLHDSFIRKESKHNLDTEIYHRIDNDIYIKDPKTSNIFKFKLFDNTSTFNNDIDDPIFEYVYSPTYIELFHLVDYTTVENNFLSNVLLINDDEQYTEDTIISPTKVSVYGDFLKQTQKSNTWGQGKYPYILSPESIIELVTLDYNTNLNVGLRPTSDSFFLFEFDNPLSPGALKSIYTKIGYITNIYLYGATYIDNNTTEGDWVLLLDSTTRFEIIDHSDDLKNYGESIVPEIHDVTGDYKYYKLSIGGPSNTPQKVYDYKMLYQFYFLTNSTISKRISTNEDAIILINTNGNRTTIFPEYVYLTEQPQHVKYIKGKKINNIYYRLLI